MGCRCNSRDVAAGPEEPKRWSLNDAKGAKKIWFIVAELQIFRIARV